MKKFQKLIEYSLHKNELKRIRLKTDPADVNNGQISQFNGYEGFFLAETQNGVKVYLENGMIITIPLGSFEDVNNKNDFKTSVINYLQNLDREKDYHNLIEIINNCSTNDQIEQYLRDAGFNNEDLLNIYKSIK
jgi:hypothetical protein